MQGQSWSGLSVAAVSALQAPHFSLSNETHKQKKISETKAGFSSKLSIQQVLKIRIYKKRKGKEGKEGTLDLSASVLAGSL